MDGIYVYCSDPAIQEYLPKGVAWLPRDPRLDSSSTLILEVLRAFAEDVPADTYVLAHATAPFISVASVESGILAVNSGEYGQRYDREEAPGIPVGSTASPSTIPTRIPRTPGI